MNDENFEPRILVFCCNWCSYAGADLAGVSRLQMPSNFRIVRVMCSGRVEPEFVMRALRNGFDGVLILACHIGDCHYIAGNHRTAKRIPLLRKLLAHVGIDSKRVMLDYVSAAEGEKFKTVISGFIDDVRQIGPIRTGLKWGA